MIVSGEVDHLPEQAFYMVGTIDEAIEKAKKLQVKGLKIHGNYTCRCRKC
jgi:hypothetical protein